MSVLVARFDSMLSLTYFSQHSLLTLGFQVFDIYIDVIEKSLKIIENYSREGLSSQVL